MKTLKLLTFIGVIRLALFPTYTLAQTLTRLPVGYGSISTNFLPLWAAKETGILAKNGLDVQMVFFTSSPALILALVSGDIAISVNPAPDVVNAHLGGFDVAFIAGGTVALDWWLVSRPEIKTSAQLKGGAVGIQRFGSSSEFAARFALERIGLVPGKDVALLQAGDPLSRMAALETGKVQANMTTAIHAFRAQKMGYNILADLAALGAAYQNAAVVTTRKFSRDHPEIVRRYVKSHLEAVHRLKTDREAGIKVLAKYVRGLIDQEVLEKSYDRAVADDMLPRKQYPSLKGIKTVLDWMGKDPRVGKVRPEDLVDTRFIKELDDGGFIDGLYR